MIRRQLILLDDHTVDYRMGRGAMEELPRLFAGAVTKPKRAVLVTDTRLAEGRGIDVSRSLIDAGFRVSDLSLPAGEHVATMGYASQLLDALAGCGATADDLIVAFGDAEVCALAQLASSIWLNGVTLALVPSTLDAMVTVATTMCALDVPSAPEMVSVRPRVGLVVCDLDLVVDAPAEELYMGYVDLVGSIFCDSRRVWERFGERVDDVAAGDEPALIDALGSAQTARSSVVKAPNPSSRSALSFGVTTARALRSCLGPEIPWWQLVAEGMRFESRLAVDAQDLDVDDAFSIDDRLAALGIDELPFSLTVERFVAALRETRFLRANRFMFSLPHNPGSVRLTVVEDDLLEQHAAAYLASRAELLDEDA